MTDGIAFSDRQVEQLTELLHSQRESTVHELKEYVEQRFVEERQYIDAKFADQDQRLDAKFATERSYFRQMIREELADIRERLDKLDARADNDARDALVEIESLSAWQASNSKSPD